MYELIPIALGAVVGCVVRDLPRGRAARITAPFALAGGLAASALSREIDASVGFVAWDALQVLVAAAATYLLARSLPSRPDRADD